MKKIPIGFSDFKRIIEEDYYYVDKSLLIKDVIDNGAQIILLPRPRRFGKTLNLYMLKYFFENPEAISKISRGYGESNTHLFENLDIWKQGTKYTALQGKFPVIFISFKDIKNSSWEMTYAKIKSLIADLYREHNYLLESDVLEEEQKSIFKNIIARSASKEDCDNSLKDLIGYLAKHHNSKVVVLIDEYDVPIQSGHMDGFYKEVVEFTRNWLSGAFKDNMDLQFACLTGILRVAKESIFSGLNNFEVYTLLHNPFSTFFGFAQAEVDAMLRAYGIEERSDEIKKWYDGYVFGETEIYNPWSILNYVKNKPQFPEPYWVNTSGNELIKELITKASPDVKKDFELLIQKKTITKPINDNIVYADIDKNENSLWSFLLMSGYLKTVGRRQTEEAKAEFDLLIPNVEVATIYNSMMEDWLKGDVDEGNIGYMLKALVEGDAATFEDVFEQLLMTSLSYFDTVESFYHGFSLGLLVQLKNKYEVKSNRESGFGRYDIMLIPKNKTENGIVIEFKMVDAKRNETWEQAAENAFKQIEVKQYEAELKAAGVVHILKYAIVFSGKAVKVSCR